ncbi:MAG: efflux RND transporter periplasmic adaptor subunit, partial [Gammaproteobacteria bacterium]|nr:efflux RND transporter periplasmic adaptor subunit [Gammaproteobacteria bacterium]
IDTQAALVDVAGAQVNVAKTALSKKRIFAPFSGKLGIRRVDIGEYIAPGSTIVTLLDLNELYLDFTLPEENFNDLVEEQLIEFRVRSYPDQTFTARVETWNPELDADTRNISIRAIVDNRKRRLAPGMFADMQVRSRRKVSVLTVPETSIFYNIYGQAVYVLEKPEASATDPDPDSRLAARQVDVAYRANGVAGITSGVKDGDLVVTAGQLKLYPNLRVAIVDDVPEYQSKAQ